MGHHFVFERLTPPTILDADLLILRVIFLITFSMCSKFQEDSESDKFSIERLIIFAFLQLAYKTTSEE